MSEEEEAAMDFCGELKALADVHEVRGCPIDKIGNAMISAGLCAINQRSRNRAETAMKACEIMENWRTFPEDG